MRLESQLGAPLASGQRRRSLWANCHPDYAARAVALAVEHAGPFHYEVFNLADEFVTEKVDLRLFVNMLTRELSDVHCDNRSLFATAKAEEVLGWEPCRDR